MPEPFVFEAQRAVPELGIRPGERVVVEPGHPRPVSVVRQLPPNFGVIVHAIRAGDLEPLTPEDSLALLRKAIADAAGPSDFTLPRRHLELCR